MAVFEQPFFLGVPLRGFSSLQRSHSRTPFRVGLSAIVGLAPSLPDCFLLAVSA